MLMVNSSNPFPATENGAFASHARPARTGPDEVGGARHCTPGCGRVVRGCGRFQKSVFSVRLFELWRLLCHASDVRTG